ncbi:MAG: glycosyltransferase, partial [Cyanothece sp. SIO1E1]|nr:glycosyltransferase [Cyanothece sp. SIO1E1]
MKPLIISTSDLDGGAARAAYRLHKGLHLQGISSRMLVRSKLSKDKSVIKHKPFLAMVGSKLTDWPLRLYRKRDRAMFSTQWFPDEIAKKVTQISPDVINLHWACNGYVQIETLSKFQRPLVWTLHDMWAFTGGCHYSQECELYTKACGPCPQLNHKMNQDISRWVWQRKAKSWSSLSMMAVTPSHWLADCARSSVLFRNVPIEVIPNGLDIQTYKPANQKFARKLLNLPEEKRIVLFGTSRCTKQ